MKQKIIQVLLSVLFIIAVSVFFHPTGFNPGANTSTKETEQPPVSISAAETTQPVTVTSATTVKTTRPVISHHETPEFNLTEETALKKNYTPPNKILTLQWKAVFDDYPPSDYCHLYITINGMIDYCVGYYWPGVNFEIDKAWQSDVPPDTLTKLSTEWTEEGQWFYIYQKSDTELAVMNHPVVYPQWYISGMIDDLGEEEYIKQYETYHEVLVIPIKKGSQIFFEDSVIEQEPTKPKYEG